METNKILGGGLLAGAALLMSIELGLLGDDSDIPQQINERAGGILGRGMEAAAPGTIYNIPASAGVTFPKAPTFDLSRMLAPMPDVTPTSPTEIQSKSAASRPATQAILTPKKAGIGFGVMPSGQVGFAPTPGYIEGVGYGVGVYPIAGTPRTAYERGAKQEREAASYLAGHPTLMHSPEGKIMARPKKVAVSTIGKDDPSTWRTRKEFMSTSGVDPRMASKYPGISKKEATSLAATSARVATGGPKEK